MKRQIGWFALTFVFLTLVLAPIPSASAQSVDRIEKISSSGFNQTVSALETAIKKRGMMIVATLDHQNMLRMVGGNIKGSKSLEFGKPDMMKSILPENPQAGLEMPLRIYVYERGDGKVAVSYYKPSAAFASYGKDPLKMAGQMMDGMLAEIVGDVAK